MNILFHKPVFYLGILSMILSIRADRKEYSSSDELLQIISDNIKKYYQYVPPQNNSALFTIKDIHQPIISYGSYDFIIVGGGTAGAVLANRLSEISQWRILLLEAGQTENDFSDIPRMEHYLWNTELNWGYFTTNASDSYKSYTLGYAMGQVLGGTSVLSGGLYVRGHSEDFDQWRLPGWSYAEVLPYFKKSENVRFKDYDIEFHSTGGYLDVVQKSDVPGLEPIIEAFKELGQKEILDYNGRDQLGISKPQYNQNNGKKISTASAFLNDEIRKRPNLNIVLGAFVTKLLFNPNQQFIRAVEFVKDGKKYFATSKIETVLSAGPINTPQILMLSGIGPKTDLENLGITVKANLPVGKKAVDHVYHRGAFIRTNKTFFNVTFKDQVELYLQGKRPLTAYGNYFSFLKLNHSKAQKRPDIEFVLDAMAPYFEHYADVQNYSTYFKQFNDLFFLIQLLHPASRGTIKLKSKNPLDFPLVDPNYYGDPEGKDIEIMYQAMLYLEKLNQTKIFKENGFSVYYQGDPFCDSLYTKYSKKWYKCIISVQRLTGLHLVGTTPMGITKGSVVNPRLRVHGFQNLRIADAGIMPDITCGHTAAPVIMIAEKAGDIIKKIYKKLN